MSRCLVGGVNTPGGPSLPTDPEQGSYWGRSKRGSMAAVFWVLSPLGPLLFLEGDLKYGPLYGQWFQWCCNGFARLLSQGPIQLLLIIDFVCDRVCTKLPEFPAFGISGHAGFASSPVVGSDCKTDRSPVQKLERTHKNEGFFGLNAVIEPGASSGR